MSRLKHDVFADIPDQDAGRYCSAIDTVVAVLSAVGVDAATAAAVAPVLLSTGEYAAGGALLSGVTGGDPLIGALEGGITGGLLSFAPEVGAALGIGSSAATALVGAGAGAIGSGITGSDPLTSTLEGGAAGFISGELNAPPAQGGAGGAPAGGGAPATAGIQEAGVQDLTLPANQSLSLPVAAQPQFQPLEAGGGAILPSGASTQIPSVPLNTPVSNFSLSPGPTPVGQFPGAAVPDSLGSAPALGPNFGSGTVPDSILKAPGSPGAGAGPSGPTSGGQLFKDLSSGNAGKLPGDIGSLVENNPGAVVSALGLGYDALKQPNLPSESSQIGALEAQANSLSKTGSLLSSYLFNGTLPPGAMAAVNQATSAAKAKIRSAYANSGLSGSSSEAEALAQVDQSAAGQVFQIADQLLQQGVTTTGLSSQLYQAILKDVTANDAGLQAAIANFATAAAGGNKGVTLNLGGAHG